MTGGEIIRAALTAGSPPPTDAGLKVRQDAADEEDEEPFIMFRRHAVDRQRGLDGTLLATKESSVVECWGATREPSDILEAQVIAAMDAAGRPCDGNEPDGLDPGVKVKANVLFVDIWTTPEIS